MKKNKKNIGRSFLSSKLWTGQKKDRHFPNSAFFTSDMLNSSRVNQVTFCKCSLEIFRWHSCAIEPFPADTYRHIMDNKQCIIYTAFSIDAHLLTQINSKI